MATAKPKLKLYWKVDAVPTGRYRSFQSRGWPKAYYDQGGDKIAVMISCADSYQPYRVASGSHGPLRVSVAKYGPTGRWDWHYIGRLCATLADAKQSAIGYLVANPEIQP
jgi:hypothetical protein